jgi:hypothetical protein
MVTNDPLATLVPQIRFGVKFLQWPVAMLVFNMLAVVLALQTNQSYRYSYSIRTSDYYEAMLLDRRTIVLRLALLFLIDAVVLYRMSKLLERQMRALRQEETAAEVPSAAVSSATAPWYESTSHIHARVSRLADQFLQRSSENTTTIFLALLLLASAVTAVASASLWRGTLLLSQAQNLPGASQETPTQIAFPNTVPAALLPWLTGTAPVERMSMHNFVHLSNGETFFRAEESSSPSSSYLAQVDTHGVLTERNDIMNPQSFVMLDNMDSFCSLYRKAAESVTSDALEVIKEPQTNTVIRHSSLKSAPRVGTQSGIICYHQSVFSDIAIGPKEDNSQLDIAIKYYEGKIWCRVMCFSRYIISVYTVVPDGPNMQVETVVSGQDFDTGNVGNDDGRDRWEVANRLKDQLWRAMAYFFALGSVVTGLWLVLGRGEPVGIAMLPIAWVVSSLAIASSPVSSAVGLNITLAGLAMASLLHNLSETTREMILWVAYSSLASVFVLEIYLGIDGGDGGNPGFMMLVWALAGITLNHPALEMVGVASGVSTLVFVVLLLTGIVTIARTPGSPFLSAFCSVWASVPWATRCDSICPFYSTTVGGPGRPRARLWPASTMTSRRLHQWWGV